MNSASPSFSARLKERFSKKTLQDQKYPFLAALVISGLVWWVTGQVITGFLVAILVTSIFDALWYSWVQGYKARIDAASTFPLTVMVNGVDVGFISDAEYAQIQLKALKSFDVHTEQIGNYVVVILKEVSAAIRAIPSLVFWMLLALVIISPETASTEVLHVATHLQRSTPAELQELATRLVVWLGTLSFIVLAFRMLLTNGLGFKNCHQARVAADIRKRLKVAAEGDVFISPTQFHLKEQQANA